MAGRSRAGKSYDFAGQVRRFAAAGGTPRQEYGVRAGNAFWAAGTEAGRRKASCLCRHRHRLLAPDAVHSQKTLDGRHLIHRQPPSANCLAIRRIRGTKRASQTIQVWAKNLSPLPGRGTQAAIQPFPLPEKSASASAREGKTEKHFVRFDISSSALTRWLTPTRARRFPAFRHVT